MGTIQVYRIEDDSTPEAFDYFDLTNLHTIALRLGDIGIVAVLTDSCAGNWALDWLLDKLRGKTLRMVQLREIAARLALANDDLRNRPRFWTEVNRRTIPASVTIRAKRDNEWRFSELDHQVLGEVMIHALGEMAMPADLEQIKAGRATYYLLNDRGEFRDLKAEERVPRA